VDIDVDAGAALLLFLDPIGAELEVTKVACHVSGLGVVDGGLVVFLYLCRFLFPSYHIDDATIGNDFSFAVEFEMLPWSVELQRMRFPARNLR
jgi:hypothetical protein